MNHLNFEKIGRYDIVRVLGKGAMGVVCEARDPNLDRQVAIKTIRVQGMSAEAADEYETRFRTEARSAARLHHPNIVSVFDFGQDGDEAYLVMEFIQGQDLKHHLECGARFSVRSAIAMVHDLLMALDHAHRQNVVHRDIKPANMLIELSGRVKLTDFGVARIQEPDEAHLTQVGGAVGTPKYMSPEQAKGQRGDSRSDLFSAGVVLYELLTGGLPFNGDNQFVIIHQIISHEPPPPSTLNPDVPRGMDAVLARALVKNPDDRYATAREFALALREVVQQVPPSVGLSPVPLTIDVGRQQLGPIVTATADAALRDGSSTSIFDAPVAAPPDADGAAEAFSVTLPMDESMLDEMLPPVAPVAAVSPPSAPVVSQAEPQAALVRSDKRLWLAGLAGMALTAVLVWRMVASTPEPEPVPTPAPVAATTQPVEEVIESAPAPKSVAKPAAPPAQTLPAVGARASAPVKPAASAPSAPMKTAAATRPATSASGVSAAASASVPVRMTSSESTLADPGRVVQRGGMGPSQPGQACADKVFIFRITCVAEQCASPRYSETQECIQFKEMEQSRAEQRARSQGH